MSDEVLDSVKKCVGVIKGAKTDTEKFAALFMVTKTVKAEKCNPRSKLALFEAIEFKFIKRLLLSDEVPAGCPPFVYKSVAMSILTALCSVQEVATHQEILQNVDVFLDIVLSEGDEDEDEADEDNLMLVNEAYKCLNFIATFEQGLKALFDVDTVGKMCKVYSQKSFQTDEALSLLVTIVEKFGPPSWENNVQNFNTLMNILAVDFETDHSDRKFKLCSILSPLLGNCPVEIVQNTCDNEIWPTKLFLGLRDILTSKLVKAQRDPAIKLASQMLTTFGAEWSLQDEAKPKAFFLMLIHLASIEIRMHLEDKKFEQVLVAENLLGSCFTILEISIAFISADTLDLEEKEKQQTYTALKGAFSAVLNVLKTLSVSKKPLETKDKCFICLMLMSLSAWLTLDTSAMKPAVNNILPFALQIANESFFAYRTRYISENVKSEDKPVTYDPLSSVDVLRAFLPALCHITVDDKGRAVLLKIKQEEVLQECLEFHWSIAHYKKPLIPKSERSKPRGPEPEIPAERLKKMADSRGAIISICNTFMNICVLEVDHVKKSPLFFTLMKFVFDNLPELKNNHENLVVYGNMAVLGLLLLKMKTAYIKKNDFSICRYIQATIRFLWDAYTVDENSNSSRFALGQLVVTMTYKESWIELQELWFLGMQNLSGILTLVPWISEFAIESGWAEGIIDMLVKIKPGSLPTNVKYAYEDLLCRLIDANSDLIATLKKKDAITACRGHKFMELGKKLFGE
ncbi:neurochondrin homolog [Acyrthosiphon pisum]|uniref:Neurochondrin homolog n=1 Tax=Acyrthosiphon pisum TaxID=7029 RepID=A0A8R1X1K0_ACYPI|nr:neurochondrin homolog [Acyrthosiphon pisum]|eukprot:XP_008180331.1 PREDICTED: neurochondrin homolog [Acyrthosiphon pisum]